VTAEDIVLTLLEDDHETLPGAMANLWYLLLTNPEQLALVRDDRRWMRFAYQETLRHSAPVVMSKRYTRHEVERFGRLLPEGALMILSAAAANRDPRQFDLDERGLFTMVRWNGIMTNPPLPITEEQLAEGFGIIDEALVIADRSVV
jgi:cytochrome P450